MKKLVQELCTRLAGGENVVMITVVARSGSAPRGAGARMLVGAQGRLGGTVGGGALEHEAERIALQALERGKCAVRELPVSCGGAAEPGMVCGGAVKLYVQYLRGGDETAVARAEEMIRLLDEGKEAWLVVTLTGEDGGCMETVSPQSDPARYAKLEELSGGCDFFEDETGQACYAERLNRGGTVYVFGGGHVSQELVPLLSHVGFQCVVLEDRAQFASPALFPDARRVMLTGFDRALDDICIGKRDYAVVMTRGHQYDLAVQRQLLRTDAGYIGVMGSRHKKEYIFGKLREEGFTDTDLARVVTPVGLTIGAETPAEVAVSVAAQLIQTRAARR